MTITSSPQLMLQDLLSRNPRVSLDEIRSFHPVFRSMSADHLTVRLSRAIEYAADLRGK
jgi:hypothetical protein